MSRLAPNGIQELSTVFAKQFEGYGVAVAYSAAGDRVLALMGEGDLVGLDPTSGEDCFRVRAHAGANGMAVNPKHPVVATAGQDGRAAVFDTRSGEKLQELPSGSPWVEHLAYSPDGELLATSSGKRVRIWRKDGEPVFESEDHESTVAAVQFGRDGKRFATCCYGGARVYSLAERKETHHFKWKGSLVALAWSPDDKVLACASQDASVHFWRLSTGRDSEMSGYRFKPKELAWDGNASLLATGGDIAITLWDFRGKGPEGTRPIQLGAHKGVVSALAFAPRKALLASGGEETAVFLWDPRKSPMALGFALLNDVVTGLAWHPKGETFAALSAAGDLKMLAARSA